MSEPIRAMTRLAAAGAVAVTLYACGGDGTDSPGGSCTRAAVPASGPGDPLSYFPSDVGWGWTYRLMSTGELATVAVTGTQLVGSETASVYTSTPPGISRRRAGPPRPS